MRFRSKTILGVALIEMALLAVLVGSTLSVLRDSNEAALTSRVQLGAKLLAAAAKDAVISQDLATLDSLVAEAMASRQIDYVRIIDADGELLAQQGDEKLLSRPFRPDKSIAQAADGIYDWAAPVMAGGIRHGEVRLGVSTDPLQGLLASAQRWAAGIAGLEMLLVALFSWLLGTYLVRQLVALRRASECFAAGDFAHRVPVQGDDELAQTALAFNRMAEQLGDSHDQIKAENQKRLDAQQEAERAQASARDRTAQLDAIFALSPDGFVSFDAAYRVKYANAAFLRLTGLAEGAVTGLAEADFSALLARQCQDDARFPGVAALSAHGERGQRQLIEMTGASRRVLEVGLRRSQAETVSQILYFRDITHESEVDRLKSEFLTTAAHELRTPMTSIYGFTELLLEQEFEAAERREFLGTIFRQSQLMVSIIDELLDLARIEAKGGKDFSISRIDLHQLLAEILAGFKASDGRPSPAQPLADGPLWLLGDSKKLTQALSNVLANAYKYSPGGGAVTIALLPPAPGSTPGQVGIRIVDQGIGMTPEQLARVFERFYRADASGKIPGTGLGMSIVQEIVALHGGSVEVASSLGAGTQVTIWLSSSDA